MKLVRFMGWSSALCLSGLPLVAQETTTVEQLQRQLKQATENFEKALQEQRQVIEDLNKKLQTLMATNAGQRASGPAGQQNGVPAVAPGTNGPGIKQWSPTDPIRIGRGPAYVNLSLDGLFAAGYSTAEEVESLQLGGHDPNQRGFTIQNIETTFEGAVDPYFRGQAHLIFQIDAEGETVVELEEAYMQTLSLPGNLQFKGGQYFSEFGRLNPTHPHAWAFVDQPLVNGRFLGPDGLRNPGMRLSWLMPTPFYSELFFSVQDSHGETAQSFRNEHEGEGFLGRLHGPGRVKSVGDLLFVPRYAVSLEPTPQQAVLLGFSGAFGPNASGNDTDTQIYGVDLFWKWKPANHAKGFPFVSWQTEAMLRQYEAGAFSEDLDGDGTIDADLNEDGVIDTVPRETLTDWGVYSQIVWGFRPRWVAGLRGDFVTRGDQGDYEVVYGNDPDRAQRWRISPNLTFYPSEFSKIRLQYNYDNRLLGGVDHSIWLQFEFLLGTHGAHTF